MKGMEGDPILEVPELDKANDILKKAEYRFEGYSDSRGYILVRRKARA